MIKDICNTFKGKLLEDAELGIIETLQGLTRVLEYYPDEESKVKRIPYPVDYIESQECQDQELTILVPDSSKRSIVYFEATPATFISGQDKSTSYSAVISLVCWYNTNGFENKDTIQTRLVSRFSSYIKSSSYSEGDFLDIGEIEVLRVVEDPSVFSKYTYDQANSQYLTHPYGYFKIEFKTDFLLYENTDCDEPIVVINTADC